MRSLGDVMLLAVDTDRLDYLREKLVEYGAPNQLIMDLDNLEDQATNVILDFDEIENCGDCIAFNNVLKQILSEEE